MKLCVIQQNGLRGGMSKKDIVRNLRFRTNQHKQHTKHNDSKSEIKTSSARLKDPVSHCEHH